MPIEESAYQKLVCIDHRSYSVSVLVKRTQCGGKRVSSHGKEAATPRHIIWVFKDTARAI